MGSLNQKEILAKVLAEYEKQSLNFSQFEVIVIDSSSTDGTVEFFKKYKPDFSFKFITQANQGKAAARNRGVKEARGKYIIITDSDMIPDKSFIKEHLNALNQAEFPCCFEGLTFNMSRLVYPVDNRYISPYIRKNYKNNSKLGWYYFLSGNVSLPKDLFLDAGGFDEDFKNYGWEDIELGYRLSKKGVPLHYLKTAVNYHYHIVSYKDALIRNIDKGASAKVFLEKYPELKYFLGINPLSKLLYKTAAGNKLASRYLNNPGNISNRFIRWLYSEYFYLKGLLD